jgi:hypothetical protein
LTRTEAHREAAYQETLLRQLVEEHARQLDAAAQIDNEFLRQRLGPQLGVAPALVMRAMHRRVETLTMMSEQCPADLVLQATAREMATDLQEAQTKRRGRPPRGSRPESDAVRLARQW